MKNFMYFLGINFVILQNVFAQNCIGEISNPTTNNLRENRDFKEMESLSSPNRLTNLEKNFIHQVIIATQGILLNQNEHLDVNKSLEIFFDRRRWDGQLSDINGDLAGSLTYYKLNSVVCLKVSFYPGDNEYGLIFEQKNSNNEKTFSRVAIIQDSEIYPTFKEQFVMVDLLCGEIDPFVFGDACFIELENKNNRIMIGVSDHIHDYYDWELLEMFLANKNIVEVDLLTAQSLNDQEWEVARQFTEVKRENVFWIHATNFHVFVK
jgi:hypothetical protein